MTVPVPPPDQDTDNLQTGLRDLAALVTVAGGLHHQLTLVARLAHQSVPGADGAGVTLLKVGRTDQQVESLAASAHFVSGIDEIQYTTVNQGPCISAALQRRTFRSGSLGGEQRWPQFGPRVGRLGVHSVLSLPLLITDQVIGAINVYAHKKDAFDERSAELGEQFAASAAVSVHNADLLERTRVLADHLQTALTSRPLIDQAIGILRARTGASADDAFARLRAISQKESLKLAVVAGRVVEQAVGRARARRLSHPPSDPYETRRE